MSFGGGSRGNTSAGSHGNSQRGMGLRSQRSLLNSADGTDQGSIPSDVAFDPALDDFLDAFLDGGSSSQSSAGAGALKRIVWNAPRFYYPGEGYEVPSNSGSEDKTVSGLSSEDEQSGTLDTELTGTDNLYGLEHSVNLPRRSPAAAKRRRRRFVAKPRTRIETAIATDKELNDLVHNQEPDPVANNQDQNVLVTCARKASVAYLRGGCVAGVMLYTAIVLVAVQTKGLEEDSNASNLLVTVSATVCICLMTTFGLLSTSASTSRPSWLVSNPNVTSLVLVVCVVLATVTATIASVAAGNIWRGYEEYDYCTTDAVYSMPKLETCDLTSPGTHRQCQGDQTHSLSSEVDEVQPLVPIVPQTRVGTIDPDPDPDLDPNQPAVPIDVGNSIVYEHDQFAGSIPTEWGEFLSLKRVVLSDNSVTGSLPTQLGRLTQLTTLTVHESFATSHLPTELGMLTALTDEVDLSANAFTSTLPTELGNLDLVSHFSFSSNALCGEVPTELSALSSQHSDGAPFSFDPDQHSG